MDNNTPFDFSASSCSREACDVRFMYYSPEEIKAISVEEVWDGPSFDDLYTPLRHGLYSEKMGPMPKGLAIKGPAACNTCGLESDCPGHMGHITLAATLYNPFLLQPLHKLLNQCCLSCRRFKADPAKTDELIRTLMLLVPGEFSAADKKTEVLSSRKRALFSDCAADDPSQPLLVEALPHPDDKDQSTRFWLENPAVKNLKENSESANRMADGCTVAAEQDVEQVIERAAKVSKTAAVTSSSSLQSCREEIGRFLKELPNICPFCKSKPAKWRKEGHSQLFVKKPGEPEALVLPGDVKSVLRQIWENDQELLRWLVPGARTLLADVYFLDVLFVPPNRFRPPPKAEEGRPPSLDRQSTHLMSILKENTEVRDILCPVQQPQLEDDEEDRPQLEPGKEEPAKAPPVEEKVRDLHKHVQFLQLAVNGFMDAGKTEQNIKLTTPGIRQEFEKKEGVFRMKMMGKRVNFAARSVISPDLNIETNEIGIPQAIAEGLQYPEVATAHNAQYLRYLVERGAKYPGATEVHVPSTDGGKSIKNLYRLKESERSALAKQLITDIESGKAPMTVFRHLRCGDPLLVNRQPTLHKPGIMAHTARVLRKEQTIRMHYANCNTYNADFDGDEMNLHAPQDPIGRMEALHIARADKQYLVPTSGKPLRGLIQDHVIAGTMLCSRDTYFDKHDLCHVLYTGLRAALDNTETPVDNESGRMWVNELDALLGAANGGSKVQSTKQNLRFKLDPPTIRKPHALWTGKQVFSMLLKNILDVYATQGKGSTGGVNLKSKSKTPGDIWNGKLDGNSEEATVLFQASDLLMGVMDKNQFGASMYGIIHLMYELAGGQVVGTFLACIARVFSMMLQKRGFTCAFRDLLLTDEAEEQRRKLIAGSRVTSKRTIEAWLKEHDRTEVSDGHATNETLSEAAQDLMHNDIAVQKMEGMIIGKMKESWTDMINKTIPVGQKVKFPLNNFSAMVQTGAKGSKVNQSQITCCLGQQELEGRLVPLMATKRSLPCFAPYDLTSRTRGYITDRFLGGIRPQEFFFHCMAGREGLVDTAVKTSRSGYLQRCLVKHLECLKVGYDMSVRDSDGSVVQFMYGEDGQDVTRASYLYKFDELRQNFHMLRPTSERKLAQLESNQGSVDCKSASMYWNAQQLVEQGKFSKASKELGKLLAHQTQVRLVGFSGSEAKANGLYSQIKLPESEKVRYMKDEDGDPMFICWDGKWFVGPDASVDTAFATKRGTDNREGLLGGLPPWKSRHLVDTARVRVLDASTLDQPTQRCLEDIREEIRRAAESAKAGGKPSLRLDPSTALFSPSHCFGSTSERHETALRAYLQKETESGAMSEDEAQAFAAFMRLKFMKCLAEPGEAVGVVAAQSMGEPSTQMTLNTFHLAGHGGANVTLGIPRLREIIQTGSKSCATPLMRVKVLQDLVGKTDLESVRKFAESLQKKFRTITILDLLARLTVHDSIRYHNGELVWSYQCQFEFLPLAGISKKVDHLNLKRIEDVMKSVICRRLKMRLKRVIQTGKLSGASSSRKKGNDEEGEVVGMDAAAAEKVDEAKVDGRAAAMGVGDDDANAPAQAKKRRKVLGAEDKAEKQEGAVDDEEDDASSDGSGMYSEKEDEDKNKDEDEEDEKEDAKDVRDEGSDDEEEDGKNPAKRPRLDNLNESGSEDEEEQPAKKMAAGASKQPVPKASTPSKEGSAQRLLDLAIQSGEVVWASKLEGDAMTVIVTHRYKDCPHSLFVGEMIQDICKGAELQDPACEGVANVHVKEEQKTGGGGSEIWLECEGINLFGLQVLPAKCIDHTGIYTNNIQKILEMYGVEAARTAVVKEVSAVFGHYGIDVDHRHLYLIADYMTQGGGMRAFNRHGMSNQMSPMLQMSYETTMAFLTTAVQDGVSDNMVSPAAAIVMGQVPQVGTGMVQLLMDLMPEPPKWQEKRTFKW